MCRCRHRSRQQKWHILAPRVRKICKVPARIRSDAVRQRHILFNHDKSWDAWSKLAKPMARSRSRVAQVVVTASVGNMLSGLESLPAELIAMILVDPALERKDVISLGLVSKTLWLHVLQHIEQDCWLTAAPMAGVEIACTGTDLRDLPQSFEKDGLVRSSVQGYHDELAIFSDSRINEAAINTYSPINEDPEKRWQAALKAHDTLAAGIPAALAGKLAVELSSRCSPCEGSSPDAIWVLRNLTTKEYIRCRPGSVPEKGRGYVDHPDAPHLRVDNVLLLRICWTYLYGWSSDEQKWPWLYHGSWAGHCFDIVPLQQGGVSAVGNGWKDSTDEIVKQAKSVALRMAPPVPPKPSPLRRKRRKRRRG